MTGTLVAAGGEEKSLRLNFPSQPPLINFFNHLFARLFQPKEEVTTDEGAQLGYVEHEPSEAKRELRDSGPLVDLLITTESSGDDDDPKLEQTSRELDAEQLARRIIELTEGANTGTAGVSPASSDAYAQAKAESGKPDYSAFYDGGRDGRDPGVKYSDIALLFRAMTNVQTYESVFRRANIPYQTVLGRGFYEREEITDLIQLLRFLDNKTDELALAGSVAFAALRYFRQCLAGFALRALARRIGHDGSAAALQPDAKSFPRSQATRERCLHQPGRTRAVGTRRRLNQRLDRAPPQLRHRQLVAICRRAI